MYGTGGYYDEYGNYIPYDSSSPTSLLLRIYTEENRLPELEAKIVKLREAYPESQSLKSMWQTYLRQQKRYDDLLAWTRKDLEKTPEADNLERQMLGLLREKKNWQESLVYAEKRATRQRASTGGNNRTVYRSTPGASTGSVRFSWSGGSTRGGYSSSASYTSSSGMSDDLSVTGELMALYAKAGKRDDAKRLENEIVNLGLTTWYRDIHMQIAGWYAGVELADEMERALALAVAANPDIALQAAAQRVAYYRKAKDATKLAAAADQQIALLEKKIGEQPYDTNLLVQLGNAASLPGVRRRRRSRRAKS